MTNLELASSLFSALAASGVREAVVCGGSRNAPLIVAIAGRDDVHLWSHFEERSAGFFALGRARATHAPVAVITTSGTAAAELLPAAIEAHYSGVPLILVTADRPQSHRGTGAPQAIEQAGLFGPYAVRADLAVGAGLSLPPWDRRGPLHLNVAFDEPLIEGQLAIERGDPIPAARPKWIDSADAARRVGEFLESHPDTLLLAGALDESEREEVAGLAKRSRLPLYAEPLSGLRQRPVLGNRLEAGERILPFAGAGAVLRLGGVPVCRFWRDLDEARLDVPVLSVSSLPFSGLARGEHLPCDLGATLQRVDVKPSLNTAIRRDRAMSIVLDQLLRRERTSEPGMIRALSEIIPEGSLVFLGNSLAIREWDLAARRDRDHEMVANRGANGIDGELSTFLGLSAPGREAWCLVGDLTALYDMASLWMLEQLSEDLALRIVVINNGGGRIFSRVPSLHRLERSARERLFENAHRVRFESWAAMWDTPYRAWSSVPPQGALPKRAVIELLPDAEAGSRFWSEWDAAWAKS